MTFILQVIRFANSGRLESYPLLNDGDFEGFYR